jgi:outer membrane protein W
MVERPVRTLFALLVLVLSLPSTPARAQERGTWALGFSFGMVSRGGLSVQYYVADRVALELHGGALPHLYNVGAGVVAHPFANERPYMVLGLSQFGFFRVSADSVSPAPSSRTVRGLNLGLGYDFSMQAGREANNFFLAAGPTLVLDGGERTGDEVGGLGRWAFFFEAGNRKFLNAN